MAKYQVSMLSTARSEGNELSALVKDFSERMKKKLLDKMCEGYEGWDCCSMEYLQTSLIRHVAKGDMIDVANIAALIWNQEQNSDEEGGSQ